jgi:adenosylcobinamide hydrolase
VVSILQPVAGVQRDAARPLLIWSFGGDVRAVSTAVVGGGIRECRWIVNAEVGDEYHRDPVEHVTELAGEWNLTGPGSGLRMPVLDHGGGQRLANAVYQATFTGTMNWLSR